MLDVDTVSVSLLEEMLDHTVPCTFRRFMGARCGLPATMQYKLSCCDGLRFICGGCLSFGLNRKLECQHCSVTACPMASGIYDLGPL